MIAGRRPVLEALNSDHPIEKVMILHGARGQAVDEIKRKAKQRGIPIIEVDSRRFRSLASSVDSQGVLATVSPAQYVELDDILTEARRRQESPFVLVLDNIEDPHNLGALIRTAEAAGVHGVVLPRHHAASVTQTVVKTSAGGVLHTLLTRVSNITRALEELKESGIWVVGTDDKAEKHYFDVDFSGGTAVVIGNESRGIRRLVKDHCDVLVRIPMFGKVSSLNASVAGGLLLYEVARARRFQPRPLS